MILETLIIGALSVIVGVIGVLWSDRLFHALWRKEVLSECDARKARYIEQGKEEARRELARA